MSTTVLAWQTEAAYSMPDYHWSRSARIVCAPAPGNREVALPVGKGQGFWPAILSKVLTSLIVQSGSPPP